MRRAWIFTALFLGLAGPAFAQGDDGGSVYGGERFTHPTRPQSVLRVAVDCDAAQNQADAAKRPDAWSLLVAGKKTGRIGRVGPSAPDDIPLDLFLVVPRDMTMLDAHADLMEQISELPYWLSAMGHRRHRVHLITYSGCANTLEKGEGATNLVAHTGSSLDRGVLTNDPKAMAAVVDTVKHDTNEDDSKVCGKFEGADAGAVVKDLVGMFTGPFNLPERQRGRILVFMHDARNVTDEPKFRGAEVQKLLEMFDQLLILQPDIAPMIWAQEVYRGGGPAGRLAKNFFAQRIREDLYRDCVELRGATACKTEGQTASRAAAATQIMATISPRTLTGSINHRQFITRSNLITLLSGSAKVGTRGYTVKRDEVDKAFKRPTGLDQLGCLLAEDGKGGLELMGGYAGQKLTCEKEASPEDDASTMAEIIHAHSPFAKSYTVEVCLDESKDKIEGPVSYRIETAGQLCVSGKRDFRQSAGAPSERMSPQSLVDSVCGLAEGKSAGAGDACPAGQVCGPPGGGGGLDFKWVGLIAAIALIIGLLVARRR